VTDTSSAAAPQNSAFLHLAAVAQVVVVAARTCSDYTAAAADDIQPVQRTHSEAKSSDPAGSSATQEAPVMAGLGESRGDCPLVVLDTSLVGGSGHKNPSCHNRRPRSVLALRTDKRDSQLKLALATEEEGVAVSVHADWGIAEDILS